MIRPDRQSSSFAAFCSPLLVMSLEKRQRQLIWNEGSQYDRRDDSFICFAARRGGRASRMSPAASEPRGPAVAAGGRSGGRERERDPRPSSGDIIATRRGKSTFSDLISVGGVVRQGERRARPSEGAGRGFFCGAASCVSAIASVHSQIASELR